MEPTNSNNLQFASLLTRFIAHLIDILISVITTLLFMIYITSAASPEALLSSLLNSFIWMVILFAISWHIVLSYLETKFGGTPGKILTGIRMVNIENNYLSFKKALFRNFVGRTVAALFLGAGYFWIFKDEKNQGWHDMVTGSYVVKRNSNGLWMGILFLILFVVIMIIMINMIINNVSLHQEMYRSLVS